MIASTGQAQIAERAGDHPPASGLFTSPVIAATAPAGALRNVNLRGPAGRLEAILNEGASSAPFSALVCHPHPVFGGNLHNKVVYHAMKVLNDPRWGFGWPVLRFNFRGAGLSEGVHDGQAEVDDVLAALDWLHQEFARPFVVAGFSFGADMALAACCRLARVRGNAQASPDIRALVALGLPSRFDEPANRDSCIRDLTIPKLFLSGDRDQFASPDQLARVVAFVAEPKQLTLIPGADHFFTDRLEPMQRTIANWLAEQL
jgi:uncharacterized protein